MVELQLCKLAVESSNLSDSTTEILIATDLIFRGVAQIVERCAWDAEVAGAGPAIPTNDQHCARHSLDVCKRARFDTLVDLCISAVDVSKTETNLTAILHDLI